MSTPEPTPGSRPDTRFNQRHRTRQAIIRAAQELVEAGSIPTVPEAADAALVSRATAYRYFATQAALLAEASLLPGLPTAAELFERPGAPTDVADRVALVSDVMHDHITSREREFRLFVREQLTRTPDGGGPSPGLAPSLPLIEAALTPAAAALTPRGLERLGRGLALLIGTEAVLAARDVLHLDAASARAELNWACRALVRGALADADSIRRKH